MLSYTLSRMLTARVLFQRDVAVRDRFGAVSARDWQPTVTVPCVWWWERQGSRGPAREEATPDETVLNAEGGMLILAGPDVTGSDRIGRVTDANGVVLLGGPLHITAFERTPTTPAMIEIAWKEPD